MPVLGHAFVGLATGMCTEPLGDAGPSSGEGPLGSTLWLPIAVGLAYLPDITAQCLLLAGWIDARVMAHSVTFAVIASIALAPMLTRLVPSLPYRHALCFLLFSILAHDALDLAQRTDRVPWWPISDRRVGFGFALIPTDPYREALLFGSLFVVFLICRQVALQGQPGKGIRSAPHPRRTRLVWAGRIGTVVIMLTSTITHYLREVRERQLEVARALVAHHDYAGAFKILDQAERWPSAAKPGRIDYLRGEAFRGIGVQPRAEQYYLRAYRADPSYFWAVADLAIFYASSGRPTAERRRLIAPYLSQLHSEFAGSQDLPQVLATIERKLAIPAGHNQEPN